MRFLLASTMLASLLLAGGAARADDGDGGEGVSIPLGQCQEVPMSLALSMVEGEAARFLPPEAAMSVESARPSAHDEARGGDPAPFSAMILLCRSAGDPGCRVQAPIQQPTRVQLEHVDHGFAPPPAPVAMPVAVPVDITYAAAPCGRVQPAHLRALFRPPRA